MVSFPKKRVWNLGVFLRDSNESEVSFFGRANRFRRDYLDLKRRKIWRYGRSWNQVQRWSFGKVVRNSFLLPAWVMSQTWMSHVTHMNESCHTYEWVMSHIWMSHVTQVVDSCHTYELVISHIWMSHVTHMNESCHTYAWVMSHTHTVFPLPHDPWHIH